MEGSHPAGIDQVFKLLRHGCGRLRVFVDHVPGFSWVLCQIVEFGLTHDAPLRILGVRKSLNVFPLVAAQRTSFPSFLDQKWQPIGILAQEGLKAVPAISCFITGQHPSQQLGKRCQKIDLAHGGAGGPRFDPLWPADDEGYPGTALVDLVFSASVNSGAVVSLVDFLAGSSDRGSVRIAIVVHRTVVAGKNYDGILGQAIDLQGLEHFSG